MRTLGSDFECFCLLSEHQRHADPLDFTVHSVTIKCLQIVVLSLAACAGSALGNIVSSGWAVSQLYFSFVKKKKIQKKRKQTDTSVH